MEIGEKDLLGLWDIFDPSLFKKEEDKVNQKSSINKIDFSTIIKNTKDTKTISKIMFNSGILDKCWYVKEYIKNDNEIYNYLKINLPYENNKNSKKYFAWSNFFMHYKKDIDILINEDHWFSNVNEEEKNQDIHTLNFLVDLPSLDPFIMVESAKISSFSLPENVINIRNDIKTKLIEKTDTSAASILNFQILGNNNENLPNKEHFLNIFWSELSISNSKEIPMIFNKLSRASKINDIEKVVFYTKAVLYYDLKYRSFEESYKKSSHKIEKTLRSLDVQEKRDLQIVEKYLKKSKDKYIFIDNIVYQNQKKKIQIFPNNINIFFSSPYEIMSSFADCHYFLGNNLKVESSILSASNKKDIIKILETFFPDNNI